MSGNFRRWRDRKVVRSKTVRFIFKVTMFDLLLKCSIIMCYRCIGTFGKIWMELRTLSEPYTDNLRKIIVKFNNRYMNLSCRIIYIRILYYIILWRLLLVRKMSDETRSRPQPTEKRARTTVYCLENSNNMRIYAYHTQHIERVGVQMWNILWYDRIT